MRQVIYGAMSAKKKIKTHIQRFKVTKKKLKARQNILFNDISTEVHMYTVTAQLK